MDDERLIGSVIKGISYNITDRHSVRSIKVSYCTTDRHSVRSMKFSYRTTDRRSVKSTESVLSLLCERNYRNCSTVIMRVKL